MESANNVVIGGGVVGIAVATEKSQVKVLEEPFYEWRVKRR